GTLKNSVPVPNMSLLIDLSICKHGILHYSGVAAWTDCWNTEKQCYLSRHTFAEAIPCGTLPISGYPSQTKLVNPFHGALQFSYFLLHHLAYMLLMIFLQTHPNVDVHRQTSA
ncbi:hypothetical protein, partial [Paenibacillus sp. N3.4]|uniref:hypothetical protein n=1 Tax=Paenibacillus sp. N3.4 TaxID=2603222 RepID=UPI001C9D3897